MDRQRWDEALGPAAKAIWEATEGTGSTAEQRIRRVPACLFADQSKAFERLSHAWLHKVLRKWGLPKWMITGLMAITAGRAVRAKHGEKLTEPRGLARSVGMGGPHSPLCWAIGYDPIVEGLEKAARCDTPTYVDDLAASTTGATQTNRAAWYLLAAGMRSDSRRTPTHASG